MSTIYSTELVRTGVLAGEAAIRLQCDLIEPEHLLLGLVSWRSRGSSGFKLIQGLGVEARDVKKALAHANPPYVTPEKYVTKLPKDCARRGKLFTITTPWGDTWGPKNWYFDRLQKLWPKIMFIQENKPKKRVVKSRASGSLYRPARWQEEKKKNFWNFFFSGTQKPVYERLS